MKKLLEGQYWTIWSWGICTKHKTHEQAVKAAKGCELRGGPPHRIYYVREVVVAPKRKA
jgi:hypothetical protein